jgi:hypothetical protein
MMVSDDPVNDWAEIGVKILSISLTPQSDGTPVVVYTAPTPVNMVNLIELPGRPQQWNHNDQSGGPDHVGGTEHRANKSKSGHAGEGLWCASDKRQHQGICILLLHRNRAGIVKDGNHSLRFLRTGLECTGL